MFDPAGTRDTRESPMKGAGRWGWIPAWWLHHPDMTPERLGLLAALTTYADDQGWCDPSQAKLARWLNRSRRWVNGAIADLAELKPQLVEKTTRTRPNGGMTSCLYRLHRTLPQGGTVFAAGPVKRHDGTDAGPDEPRCDEAGTDTRSINPTGISAGSPAAGMVSAIATHGTVRQEHQTGYGTDVRRGQGQPFSSPEHVVLTNQPQAEQIQESPPAAAARPGLRINPNSGSDGEEPSRKSIEDRTGDPGSDRTIWSPAHTGKAWDPRPDGLAGSHHGADERSYEEQRAGVQHAGHQGSGGLGVYPERAGADAGVSGSLAGSRASSQTGCHPALLPADWKPSAEVLERAKALYPDEDLDEHAALFVARCRGKGYSVVPAQADDFWLSWLIEDARKARIHKVNRRSTRSGAHERDAGRQGDAGLDSVSGGGSGSSRPKLSKNERDRIASWNRYEAWGIAASS